MVSYRLVSKVQVISVVCLLFVVVLVIYLY